MGYVIQLDGESAGLARAKQDVTVYLNQEEFVVHYIPSFNAPQIQLGDKVMFNDERHIVKSIEVLNPSVTKLIVTPMP